MVEYRSHKPVVQGSTPCPDTYLIAPEALAAMHRSRKAGSGVQFSAGAL